ncbi:hypothetical protein U8V72_24045 [Priestia filamentosa]|uniref:hypothetical protein n=1 Tax=Priestia filamentosa TaxID=1402861 RepID=UPI003978519A
MKGISLVIWFLWFTLLMGGVVETTKGFDPLYELTAMVEGLPLVAYLVGAFILALYILNVYPMGILIPFRLYILSYIFIVGIFYDNNKGDRIENKKVIDLKKKYFNEGLGKDERR